MTRGNQREINRERAQKREANAAKPKGDHSDMLKRQMNDADKMREKQKLAEEKRLAEEVAKSNLPKPSLVKIKF